MKRESRRIDRFASAIGPERLSTLLDEWIAIGNGRPPLHSCFDDVAMAARWAGVTPEVMLVAMRFLARSAFREGTAERERIDHAWQPSVRILINAFYRREPLWSDPEP